MKVLREACFMKKWCKRITILLLCLLSIYGIWFYRFVFYKRETICFDADEISKIVVIGEDFGGDQYVLDEPTNINEFVNILNDSLNSLQIVKLNKGDDVFRGDAKWVHIDLYNKNGVYAESMAVYSNMLIMFDTNFKYDVVKDSYVFVNNYYSKKMNHPLDEYLQDREDG